MQCVTEMYTGTKEIFTISSFYGIIHYYKQYILVSGDEINACIGFGGWNIPSAVFLWSFGCTA